MQSEMDFGIFATAAANHARRRNAPPVPDADGLFDAEGVMIICGRRQCHFEPAGELFGTVQFKETKIRLTAIAPGKWDPVAVLSACTRAQGRIAFMVDYDKSVIDNAGGIDEFRVARVIGADGVRPYIPKVSWLTPTVRSVVGAPTYALYNILHSQNNLSDYRVRRALRALEDCGLIDIQLGPRGGMATARLTWKPAAFLPMPRLADEDEAALEMLA